MVLTILKNISQWEGLSHILWEKKMFQTTNQTIIILLLHQAFLQRSQGSRRSIQGTRSPAWTPATSAPAGTWWCSWSRPGQAMRRKKRRGHVWFNGGDDATTDIIYIWDYMGLSGKHMDSIKQGCV